MCIVSILHFLSNFNLWFKEKYMKKSFFLFILLLCAIHVRAQVYPEGGKSTLVTAVNSFRFSRVRLLDTYLSPLYYKGLGITYENDRRRFFSPENDRLSMQSRVTLKAAVTFNPSRNSTISCLAANYAWGMHYHLRPARNLQLLIGGIADMDIGGKFLGRNVNRPANLDFATGLHLSFLLQYKIPAPKRDLILQVSFIIPVMGFMFVPEMGASYYEILSLGNFKNSGHFTSFHNRYGISQTYTIDIPFRKSVWRFGFSSQYLKYGANHLIFKRRDVGILIGWKRDLAAFSGRKSLPPANFIKSDL